MIEIQQMRLVVGIHNEVTATRLITWRSEPIHNKINNLRTKMETFIFDINTKLGKQNGWIVDKAFLMMNLASNLLLPRIRQLLGEDTGVGNGETCHYVGRIIRKAKIIGLAERTSNPLYS